MIKEAGFAHFISSVRQQAGTADFDLAIILGSGLGGLADAVTNPAIFPYRDFSCFPPVSVPGHAGCLLVGQLLDWRVLLFAGRLHLYEGCTAFQATLPVRLAGELGCRRLLLTNAAGGVRDEFAPGDFMFIADHLNLLGDNPLRTLPDSFVDLSHLYRCDFFSPLQEWAIQERIPLHSGVLAALPGPSYETPAEIRMLRNLGADAVSMSTIPEALMGRYLGMDIAGLSLIANKGAGLAGTLSHDEVLDVGQRSTSSFIALVLHLISVWQAAE